MSKLSAEYAAKQRAIWAPMGDDRPSVTMDRVIRELKRVRKRAKGDELLLCAGIMDVIDGIGARFKAASERIERQIKALEEQGAGGHVN